MIPEALLEKARMKGTDSEYQAYVRQWPSVLTDNYNEWENGEGRSVYAHVRRVSAGSGVAYKPEYSGVPLSQAQHFNTHQHGESYYNKSEWWERQARRMLTNWINNVAVPMVEDNNKVVFTLESAEHLRAFQERLEPYFKNPGVKPLELIIRTGKKRTDAQNRSMWGVIYGDIVKFYAKNPKALASDVVEYVLAHKPSIDFVHDMMKGLCNNGKSTARLKVPEHCSYFERIANRFMDKHKHEVKMPVNKNGYNGFYD